MKRIVYRERFFYGKGWSNGLTKERNAERHRELLEGFTMVHGDKDPHFLENFKIIAELLEDQGRAQRESYEMYHEECLAVEFEFEMYVQACAEQSALCKRLWPSSPEHETVSTNTQDTDNNDGVDWKTVDMGGYQMIPREHVDEVYALDLAGRKRLYGELRRQEDPNYETGSEEESVYSD